MKVIPGLFPLACKKKKKKKKKTHYLSGVFQNIEKIYAIDW